MLMLTLLVSFIFLFTFLYRSSPNSHAWFCFLQLRLPRCQPWSDNIKRKIAENKQFLSFKWWGILNRVMKFQAFLLCPTQDQDVNHLFVHRIHAIHALPAFSYLVTILVIRLAVVVFIVTAS